MCSTWLLWKPLLSLDNEVEFKDFWGYLRDFVAGRGGAYKTLRVATSCAD